MKEDKVASHHDTLTSMRCEKIDFIHACTWFLQFLCFCALSFSAPCNPEWHPSLHSMLPFRQLHAEVAQLPLHAQDGAPTGRGRRLRVLVAEAATGDVGVGEGGVLRFREILCSEPLRGFVGEGAFGLFCLAAFFSLPRRYDANARR